VSGEEAGLVRRCLAGDEKAYRELVERYQGQVYSLALRMVRRAEDAEDLTQETFVRMFRALARYDTERPFAAWLFTIASRLCIDHIRRRKVSPISLIQRERESDEEYEIEVEDPGLKPDEVAAHSEESERTSALIESLPPHYRIVVLQQVIGHALRRARPHAWKDAQGLDQAFQARRAGSDIPLHPRTAASSRPTGPGRR
jgi:RNA polymerase sigma-70 factor (ECF subfamily)